MGSEDRRTCGRRLTIRSTGHFAACGSWASFHSRPTATCRKMPVSSNVRPLKFTTANSGRKIPPMAPTIVRDGKFRLFFFSREETKIHVHISHPDGEAKFWLKPDIELAVNVGLSQTQVRQAHAVVSKHIKEIEDAWNHHFGN